MSHKQLVYLSRHAQVLHNALQEQTGKKYDPSWSKLPDLKEFTLLGERQIPILGAYSAKYILEANGIAPKDVIIVTSSMPRSIQTGEGVRHACNIPLSNAYSSAQLDEEVPMEIIPEDKRKGAQKRGKGIRSKDQIAKRALGEMESILRSNPDKTVIAPLHGLLDQVILEHLGLGDRHPGNCSITPLAYDHQTGRVTQVGDYITVEEMEAIMKGGI